VKGNKALSHNFFEHQAAALFKTIKTAIKSNEEKSLINYSLVETVDMLL
jgi:hypothetical protein